MKLKIKISHHFGFTLIELLVVIAVMGILSSVSYIGIQEVRKTIRDNKRRADLNEVARALELFKADYGQYPVNNYTSANDSGDKPFLSFLKNGGNISLIYPGGEISKDINGGYLAELKKDPINMVSNGYQGYMYAYYGANWINFLVESWSMDDFPLTCPSGGGTCQNFEECCNGGCYDSWCNYDSGQVTYHTYSMNGWSSRCYGAASSRSMSVLMTRLEKESKTEERFDKVFSFCPTADMNHPDHASFLDLEAFFPRSKACYAGGGESEYTCGSGDWNSWALDEYNYFVPLTGEFNLR